MGYKYYRTVEEVLALAWETYNPHQHHNMSGVYLIADKETNEIVYAGKARNFGNRFVPSHHHVYRAEKHFIKVLRVDDKEERSLMEYDLIRLLKPALNERAGTCPKEAAHQLAQQAYRQIFG